MKKLHILLIIIGSLLSIGIAIVRWIMYGLREKIDSTREFAGTFSTDDPNSKEAMESTWPLLDQLEMLDLLSKVLLIAGPLVLITGAVLFLTKRRKS